MINYQGEDFTETEFYGREIYLSVEWLLKFHVHKIQFLYNLRLDN